MESGDTSRCAKKSGWSTSPSPDLRAAPSGFSTRMSKSLHSQVASHRILTMKITHRTRRKQKTDGAIPMVTFNKCGFWATKMEMFRWHDGSQPMMFPWYPLKSTSCLGFYGYSTLIQLLDRLFTQPSWRRWWSSERHRCRCKRTWSWPHHLPWAAPGEAEATEATDRQVGQGLGGRHQQCSRN